MSKASSVFSLRAMQQKNHRFAIATFTAITSLIAQASYAGCPDGYSPSAATGQCILTITVVGKRDNGFANQLQNQKLPNDPSVAELPKFNVAAAPNASTGSATDNSNSQGSATANSNSQEVNQNQNVGNITKEQKAWNEEIAGKSGRKGSKDSENNNPCAASEGINSKYECNSTYSLMENAKLTSQITQAAGGSAVNASGTVANIKAQNAGTQSAVAEAAASTSEKAGMLQTALGIASAAVGAYEIKRSVDHKGYGREIGNEFKAKKDAYAATGVTPGTTPEQYKTALGEQSKVEKTAMQAGAMAVYQGAVQASAGMMAIAAAKQAKELAGKLQDATGTSYQITSANPTDLTNTGTTSTAINPGTATDPAVATTDGTIKANDVPTITPPVNPDATSGGAGGGPVAGGFTPGSPQAAGGGGGSPGIGVGSMQAAKGDPEPTGPKMADTKGNSSYAQGSGAGFAAGGGVSAEKSADLGFLANLLPKPQEEMGKNGILDYGGGRAPASMAPYSFLGKDVNIFQRISDRTTAKFKSGDVGGS